MEGDEFIVLRLKKAERPVRLEKAKN